MPMPISRQLSVLCHIFVGHMCGVRLMKQGADERTGRREKGNISLLRHESIQILVYSDISVNLSKGPTLAQLSIPWEATVRNFSCQMSESDLWKKRIHSLGWLWDSPIVPELEPGHKTAKSSDATVATVIFLCQNQFAQVAETRRVMLRADGEEVSPASSLPKPSGFESCAACLVLIQHIPPPVTFFKQFPKLVGLFLMKYGKKDLRAWALSLREKIRKYLKSKKMSYIWDRLYHWIFRFACYFPRWACLPREGAASMWGRAIAPLYNVSCL